MMKRFIPLFLPFLAFAQYSPPAGQPGSSAVPVSDPSIAGWAVTAEVTRGYLDINDTSFTENGSNRVSYGDPQAATGPAEGSATDIVSLGDAGTAVLTFAHPIMDGPGYDLAVFENSFSDDFLELAFVEVSSDGINYTRFPAISLTSTATQTSTYGTTNCEGLYNLAGSFRQGYGTPFDLSELAGTPGLDIMQITHVRIVDVIGSVTDSSGYDSQGNRVNDPYPSAFASGGFDLDGVAVRYFNTTGGLNAPEANCQVWPNPFRDVVSVKLPGRCSYRLTDANGRVLESGNFNDELQLDMRSYPAAVMLLELSTGGFIIHKKLVSASN